MDSKEKVLQYLEQLPVPPPTNTDNNSAAIFGGVPLASSIQQLFSRSFSGMTVQRRDNHIVQVQLPLPRGYVPGMVRKVAIDESNWSISIEVMDAASQMPLIQRVNWYNEAQQQHVHVDKTANVAFSHAVTPERMASFPPLPLVLQPVVPSQQIAPSTGRQSTGPRGKRAVNCKATRSQVRAGNATLAPVIFQDVPSCSSSSSITMSVFDVPHITRVGGTYLPSITEHDIVGAPHDHITRYYQGLDRVMAHALARGDCRTAHQAWKQFQMISQITLVCSD